jgi:hypothetical protein
MITTAEGVENEEQLEILRAEGCMQDRDFSSAKQCRPPKSRCCYGACNRGFKQPSRFTPRFTKRRVACAATPSARLFRDRRTLYFGA